MPRAEKTIPNFYRDSVALMEASARIERLLGVTRAAAIMATQANIDLLKDAGFATGNLSAKPNDLLIIIEGRDNDAIANALKEAELDLQKAPEIRPSEAASAALPPSSIAMAKEDMPDANFALISTPGEYAAAEAEKALRLGLNTMVFSANVALDDEIALKKLAIDNDLLMMGPDCGTAIVNGIPLGFANVLRRGSIGLVASAGTGLQQVSSLIDRAGIGISQAIGCGSRDLSEAVGGASMLKGLDALAEDSSTQIIVLVAKHPSLSVARRICEAAEKIAKPVVVNFLGIEIAEAANGKLHFARTLEDAAQIAAALARGEKPTISSTLDPVLADLAREASSRLGSRQKYVRGLFSGGTFCYEAQVLLAEQIGPVWSNTPVNPANALSDIWVSRENAVIDLGDEAFTRGRPHPMIDQRLRLERIAQEAKDPETAVILLDVVLGYGSHPNPATEIANVITKLRDSSKRDVIFVASVCGTPGDPQKLTQQERVLRDAGVLLTLSNASAARLAATIVKAQRNPARAA